MQVPGSVKSGPNCRNSIGLACNRQSEIKSAGPISLTEICSSPCPFNRASSRSEIVLPQLRLR